MAIGVRAGTREAARRGLVAATSWYRRPVGRADALALLAPFEVGRWATLPVTHPASRQHGGPPRFQTEPTFEPPHDDLVHVVPADGVDDPLRLTRHGGLRLGRQLLDLDFGTASGLLELPSPRSRRVPGDVLAPWSHHWGERYYDWVVMVLAKLVRFEAALGADRFRAARLALTHTDSAFHRWYLHRLGVLDRLVAPDEGPPLAPERVVVGPNQPWFRPSRSDLLRLRSRFLHDRPGPGLGPRLYVQRGGRRRVANEDELLPVLAKHGVTLVEDGRHDVGEQIALFRDAELVVAPHGAALTNLVWSSPGTRVLELFDATYSPDPFRHLCAVLGHEHHVLVDGDVASDTGSDHANVGADLLVDPFRLDKALTAIG